MKVGDKFPVTIAGHEVTVAVVRAVENGQVELQFEGKRVVMATRTEIEATAPKQTGTEHAILGVEAPVQPEHVNAQDIGDSSIDAANLAVPSTAEPESAQPDNAPADAPAVEPQDTQVVQNEPVSPVVSETAEASNSQANNAESNNGDSQ